MTEFRAGRFGKTISDDVTDTPGTYAPTGAPAVSNRTLIVQSDKVVHLLLLGAADSGTASTTNGMRVPADMPVKVSIFGDDTLSFVLGDGETDGTIWFTEVPN